MKRLLLPLFVAAALLAGACGTSGDAAFTVEAITIDPSATPAAPAVDGDTTTTTEASDGEEITIPGVEASREDVDSELDDLANADEFVAFVESSGGVITNENGLDPEYVAQYLSDRIVFAIIDSEVDRRDLEVTDEDREAGRTELEARLAPQADPTVPADPEAPTGADVLGFMPESYRDFLVNSFAEVSVLQEALAAEAGPSDEEIRAVYDDDPSQFEQACGAHILIAANDDAAAGELVSADQAEAGAQLVIDALDAGADFATLATEQSDDPGSGAQGGDLGCAGRGSYVPEFEEAMFGAEPGEIVGPVITQFGAHVIRLDELQQPSFEEARDQIVQQLTGGADPFSSFIQLAIQAADVTVDERYGTWSSEEGRVVAPVGPGTTTTTVPGFPLDSVPAPTTTPGG